MPRTAKKTPKRVTTPRAAKAAKENPSLPPEGTSTLIGDRYNIEESLHALVEGQKALTAALLTIAEKFGAAPAPKAPRVKKDEAEHLGNCTICGIRLTPENSSKLQDGKVIHVGCTAKVGDNKGEQGTLDPSSKPAPKAAKVVSIEDARQAMVAHVQKHGKESVLAIFKKMGAGRLTEIPEEKLGSFVEACNG